MIIELMLLSSNTIACTCRDQKRKDEVGRTTKDDTEDDQLLDTIIQLCMEDTFPYSNAYFKKHVGKVRDFESTPTKHFHIMMENVMRVLKFDQDTCKRFRQKIHQYVPICQLNDDYN